MEARARRIEECERTCYLITIKGKSRIVSEELARGPESFATRHVVMLWLVSGCMHQWWPATSKPSREACEAVGYFQSICSCVVSVNQGRRVRLNWLFPESFSGS